MGGTTTVTAWATRSSCLSNQWTGREEAVTTYSNFFFLISRFSYKAWRNSKGRSWLTPRWRAVEMSEAISENLQLEIPAQDHKVHAEDSGKSHQQRTSDLVSCWRNEQGSPSFCYILPTCSTCGNLLLRLKTRVRWPALWSSGAYLQSWWSL